MNLHGSFRPCSTKYTESLPVESGTLSGPVTNTKVGYGDAKKLDVKARSLVNVLNRLNCVESVCGIETHENCTTL